MFANGDIKLPMVDLSGYLNPQKPGDQERVVAEVRDACAEFGFFRQYSTLRTPSDVLRI